MHQIEPHLLWIGHAGDGRDLRAINEFEIRAIVQLAMEEPPLHAPRELVLYRFPCVDGSGNDPAILSLAAKTVAELIRQRMPTLVCCGAGMSRSPAVVAAALSMVEDTDVEASLLSVIRSHPADVSPAFWDEVCRALGKAGGGGD